jgi:hypothetical protein
LWLYFTVPATKEPYHEYSNKYWHHDLSSPITENSSSESVDETTTMIHEPFFDETAPQINVTTQLGNDVFLHCRVNDLREKMVRENIVEN